MIIFFAFLLILGTVSEPFAVSAQVIDTTNKTSNVEYITQATTAGWDLEIEWIRDWQANNMDLEIIVKRSSIEGQKADIRALLNLQHGPDVVGWYAGGEVSRSLIADGKLHNLHQLFTDYHLYSQYPAGLLQSVSNADGHPFMLPTDYYHWGIYYRKSLLADHGKIAPKTWTDFLALCAYFKGQGILPISIGIQHRWTLAAWFDYLNMRINGPEFHVNVTAGSVEYTDPRIKNVFHEWKMLLNLGYFPDYDVALSHTHDIARVDLETKTAAFTLMGDFFRADIEDENVKADFDFFRFPIMDPNVLIGEDAPADGFAINANAPNMAGADRLLAQHASKDVQIIRVAYRAIPANLQAAAFIVDPVVKKGADMIAAADFVLQFFDRDTTPAMADAGLDAMMAFAKDGGASIDDILESLEVSRKQIYFGITANPLIQPPGDAFADIVWVNLTCATKGAEIYYTVDGTRPTEDAVKYLAGTPILLDMDGRNVVRAIAVSQGLKVSSLVQEIYQLDIAIEQKVTSDMALVGIVLTVVGIFTNMAFNKMISNNSSEPALRAASPTFVQTIILGSSVAMSTNIWMVIGPILGMGNNIGSAMCTVQTWSFSIGWSLMFGSLLSKTWRVIQIFENEQTKKKRGKLLSNKQLTSIVVSVTAMESVLCLAWMVRGPMTLQRVNLSSTAYTFKCVGEQDDLWIVIFIMPKIGMLLLAVVASYKTRNYVAAFNESRNIAFAVYNIALIGGASYSLSNSIDNVELAYIIRVVGLFVTCITVTIVIALPPLYTIRYHPELNTPKAWFSNTGATPHNVGSHVQPANPINRWQEDTHPSSIPSSVTNNGVRPTETIAEC